MLREEISNIKVSFETIDAIIEALSINIQKYEDIKDFCTSKPPTPNTLEFIILKMAKSETFCKLKWQIIVNYIILYAIH